MLKIFVFFVFCSLPVFALADCKQIYNDVEESLKDIAAFKSTANSYRESGFISKSNSFDQKIATSQSQINTLLTQARGLKCKPYKDSLNADKYLKAADNCGKNPETVDFDCNRENWKPSL
ncbi:hypothetical protein AB719_13865 [Acinetobacter baumannii]|nr:hypothetical protein [Acinetobacter baumannii]RDJ56817.1 hypothetical protein AB719_13865 [Acinetobacter baumannii]